ncbi:MAG: L-2-amino-thiazoline-4-carboxylic acid hydrolase [Anaerolineales bacterium]|nr:L-2-amino-thiazoline-4-carboxylic acid hydrolase [Anaerolineales bacterium]
MKRQPPTSPDALNAIGVLTRREVEARLAAPLLEAFARQLGRKKAVATLRQVVVDIARAQGAELARQIGGSSLAHLAASFEAWMKDDAMRMEVLVHDEGRFFFNVTRCRYAEMYAALGMTDLGAVLSCSRDVGLVAGFNPAICLERAQTIMEGAPFCDFRYTLQPLENDPPVIVQGK